MSTQHKITVELGDRSYPIVIGNGLLDGGFDIAEFVRGPDCLIVSDGNVSPLYRDRLLPNLDAKTVTTIDLPDGESHKTVATMQMILDRLVATRAARDTTIIALGGGVVGDITGFAAACYMRGVAFIQIPTTLLAQVDSSVGGKTGVNHELGKNLIGAFHQPQLVMIDTDTLLTLPDRELKAGLAEVIKYGAICDLEFFAWLEENMQALLQKDPAALAYAIQRSCEIKAEVVSDDEREAGRRAILNFGHTFGHAIEHCQGYGEWLHGEAVAAGMVMAAELSAIDELELERLRSLLNAAGLPVTAPQIDAETWIRVMATDKKVAQQQLHFVLLHSLGDAYVTASYDEQRLQAVIGAAA
jgi:3-dehydroquinate synthase